MPTDEEYAKFRRAVIKKLRVIDDTIGDIWQKISDNDDRHTQLEDEIVDRAARAERAVRRLRKEFDDHEHEEE